MATKVFLTLDESDYIDDVCVCTEAKTCKEFLTQLFRELPNFYAQVSLVLYPGDLEQTVKEMLGGSPVKAKLPEGKTNKEILEDITKHTAESVHEIINTLLMERHISNQLDVDVAKRGRVIFSDLKDKSLLASLKA